MRSSNSQARATLRVLLAIVLLTYVAQNMLNVSIAPLARALDLAEWVVGLAVSMAAVFVALLSQFWGRRSLAWGRRRVLLISLVLALIAGTLFSVAVGLRAGGILGPLAASIAIVVARGPFFGSAVAAIPPTGQALIAEITPDEASRVKGMASFSGAIQLSIMIGSVVSSALAAWWIFAPVHATPWFILVALILALLFLPKNSASQPSDDEPSVPASLPPRVSWADPRISPWILSAIGTFFTAGVVQITMGFLVEDRLGLSTQTSVSATGLMLLANAAGAMVTQLIILPHLGWPPRRLLRMGTLLGLLALTALAFSNHLALIGAATLMLGVASGLVGPGFNAGGSLAVTDEEQGGVAGVLNATGALTWIVAPVTATALYSWQPLAPFALAGTVLAFSTLTAWTRLGRATR